MSDQIHPPIIPYTADLPGLYRLLHVPLSPIMQGLLKHDPHLPSEAMYRFHINYGASESDARLYKIFPVGVLRKSLVKIDFWEEGMISHEGESTFANFTAKAVELGEEYGNDRVIPVLEHTLTGITSLTGVKYGGENQNPFGKLHYFILPKPLDEYKSDEGSHLRLVR